MSMSFKIDATMISQFMRCKEEFRQRHVEKREPAIAPMHREFGSVIHRGIESFWLGQGYEKAMRAAIERARQTNQTGWNVREIDRWDELVESIPDMLAAYFEEVEWKPALGIEREFPQSGEEKCLTLQNSPVIICGKLDRLMLEAGGLRDYEPKTASEIGGSWKKNFKSQWVRSWQFALYDWAIRRLYPTDNILPPVVECLIKPYKAKKARVERIELPEIIAHRQRFEQQLEMTCAEMVHYMTAFRDVKPWPMSDSACIGKYGPCDYLELCESGENARTKKKFVQIERYHLEVMNA